MKKLLLILMLGAPAGALLADNACDDITNLGIKLDQVNNLVKSINASVKQANAARDRSKLNAIITKLKADTNRLQGTLKAIQKLSTKTWAVSKANAKLKVKRTNLQEAITIVLKDVPGAKKAVKAAQQRLVPGCQALTQAQQQAAVNNYNSQTNTENKTQIVPGIGTTNTTTIEQIVQQDDDNTGVIIAATLGSLAVVATGTAIGIAATRGRAPKAALPAGGAGVAAASKTASTHQIVAKPVTGRLAILPQFAANRGLTHANISKLPKVPLNLPKTLKATNPLAYAKSKSAAYALQAKNTKLSEQLQGSARTKAGIWEYRSKAGWTTKAGVKMGLKK